MHDITTRNHCSFDYKARPKTIDFDIWSIWPFGHIKQVDLNTSNLIGGFFKIDRKMIFLLLKLNKKIGQPKNIN
jgi:hypothetical protein